MRNVSYSDSISVPITIQEADLPVVSFTQYDNTLQINLSKPAPEKGFTVDYQNVVGCHAFNLLVTADEETGGKGDGERGLQFSSQSNNMQFK